MSVCCNHVDDVASAAQYKTSRRTEDGGTTHSRYLHKHVECRLQACGHVFVERLHLAILGTCRQVHQEASLLPFKQNTFSCDDRQSLRSLLLKLRPAQSHALESLTLLIHPLLCTRLTTNLIEDKLRNLKKFTSIIDVGIFYYHVTLDSKVWDLWASKILKFSALPIATAIVVIHPISGCRLDFGSRLNEPRWVEAWESRLEGKLLATGDLTTAVQQ